jgi:hypothetical protein
MMEMQGLRTKRAGSAESQQKADILYKARRRCMEGVGRVGRYSVEQGGSER